MRLFNFPFLVLFIGNKDSSTENELKTKRTL